MKLLQHLDHVQMRDGSAFLGDVINPTFTLQAHALGAVKIQADRIISITFHGPSTGPEDRVILKDGGQLFGKTLDTVVEMDDDGLGRLKLQTSEILAIQYTF